jgi:hypothetical protein
VFARLVNHNLVFIECCAVHRAIVPHCLVASFASEPHGYVRHYESLGQLMCFASTRKRLVLLLRVFVELSIGMRSTLLLKPDRN